jgi:hypothetical protein
MRVHWLNEPRVPDRMTPNCPRAGGVLLVVETRGRSKRLWETHQCLLLIDRPERYGLSA